MSDHDQRLAILRHTLQNQLRRLPARHEMRVVIEATMKGVEQAPFKAGDEKENFIHYLEKRTESIIRNIK